MRSLIIGMSALALTSGALAGGGDLWDNNMEPDGFNGRALSPPNFPDIRVADDFVVSDPAGWRISDFHVTVIEDIDWVSSGRMEFVIYRNGDCPGPVLGGNLVPIERMATGDELFGRAVYEYWAFFDPIKLPRGRYWIGHRDPGGQGVGTNYWLTSDGGPDGAGTAFGCFSLDAGQTWQTQGEGWQMAFKITGAINCEPCKGDINGDCFVNFDDLLQVLSGWGPCPSSGCPEGGVCGDFPACGDEGCLCFMRFGGGGICFDGATPCDQPLCLGGPGDCPPGWECAVETCCGEPICVPPERLCDTSGPRLPPPPAGTPTVSGIQK